MNLTGLDVYLDANALIYAVENPAEFPNLLTGLLLPLERGELVGWTSEITVLETIVGPRKRADARTEQVFRSLLTPSDALQIIPISRDILERAIGLRAHHGFRTPDAIHLATGIEHRCDVFLTRDIQWARAGVRVVPPELVA